MAIHQAAFFFLNAAHLFRWAAAMRLRASADITRLPLVVVLWDVPLLATPSSAAMAWLRRSRSRLS
jgi:hypothetical protein